MDETPNAAGPPVLDCEQIDGLVAVAGKDGARSILDAFWRSTDSLLSTLKTQLASGDLAAAAKTAHALKGSSLNVGAVRLSAAARRVEEACRRQDEASADNGAADVRAHLEATAAAFDAHLAA